MSTPPAGDGEGTVLAVLGAGGLLATSGIRKAVLSVAWVVMLTPPGTLRAESVGPAARRAFLLTGIQAEKEPIDSVETRVRKILNLLVDKNYMGSGLGAPDYALDSQRNAERVLAERKGGGCGSYAMALAELLKASGISEDRLRIVGAATNQTYSEICTKAGNPRIQHPDTDAAGHVFVMVRQDDGQWILVNTTTASGNMVDFISDLEAVPLSRPYLGGSSRFNRQRKNGPREPTLA